MNKAFLILVGVLLCTQLCAQENLVPNGGFENLTVCPYLGQGGGEIWLAEPWNNITDFGGGADIFNDCAELQVSGPDTFYVYSVPENNRGNQPAKSGDGYAGFYALSDPETYPNQRDFLTVLLNQPLHTGVRYEVVFYVSLAEKFQYAVGYFGTYFSENRLTASDYQIPDGIEPQVQGTAGVIYDDKENWMEVRDTFVVRGEDGQQWMTIGNFLPDSLSQITFVDSGAGYGYDRSYYYIDDVSVVAIDSVPNSVTELEEKDNGLLIYPNPNHGLFTMNYALEEQQRGELRVFDVSGKVVFETTLSVDASNVQIHLSDIQSGLYMIRLEVGGAIKLAERISVLK